MVRCPSCGHENREDASYCSRCANSIAAELPCSSCGRENPATESFCDGCGKPLTDSKPVAATPTPAPALPAAFADGRYQVQRCLGEGGKKRTYLAHDTKLDSDVAIAVIKTEGLDAEGLTRVQREAQAMGRLRDHPNIVTVLDIGDDGGQPYIVMELLEGGSLADVLQEAEEHRLPLDDALRIAQQMCEALEHAHGRGITHRDLKPGNVWLTSGGMAKLGDFGLAVASDRSRLTQEGMILGTATYMPPEQAMGNEATPHSDLYSLGCVLYEMVAGRPPFVGEESVAVITQHLNTTPVSPSWHRPDVPSALEALVLRLLEKDPEERPASAADVRQSLASIDLSTQPAAEAGAAALPPGATGQSPLYRQTFVGREDELRQLKTAFDKAASGQGALIMVVGEPGIGKTTMCEQLSTHVALRGGRTLLGHCYEEGSLSLPYLPFVEAMRSYVLERDAEALREELGTGAYEVASIVTEIRDRVDVEVSAPGDPEEERYRLLQAVTAFLRNAASVQPLCIVLEDLHDADDGSLDLLRHLARNLARTRLLIVGTYRDIEVDRAHPLSSALAELRRTNTFSRVLLRGLGQDEVLRMIHGIADQEVPWRLAEAVHRQTEGNPLFIQEVLRYLVEEGLFTGEGGRWDTGGDTTAYMAIPEGLRDVIGKRLSRLSADCNSLLAIAAVIGRDFTLDALRALCELDEEQLISALEEAVRVDVLEERSQAGDVRYRFSHAFFRQTLYEEMIAPRRIRLHQQVARALEELYADRVEDHAPELAEHFSYFSDPEDLAKAVAYGKAAAERSLRVYAYGEAARLLQQAIQVQEVLDPKDQAQRCDLLIALGEALMPAGEPRRVIDVVAPEAFALAQSLDDPDRAATVCRMACVALSRYGTMIGGENEENEDMNTWWKRLDGYAAPGTNHRVQADIILTQMLYGDRRWSEARDLGENTLKAARTQDDLDNLFFAARVLIQLSWAAHHWKERLLLANEFFDRSRQGVSPRSVSRLLMSCFLVFLAQGERARAQSVLNDVEELADLTREPELMLATLQAEATFAAFDGRLEEAIELVDRHVDLAGELGVARRGMLLGIRPLLQLGRADEVLAMLDEPARTSIFVPPMRAVALAHLGRNDEAEDALHRLIDELGIGEERDETPAVYLVRLLETATLVGDATLAKQLAGRLAEVSHLAEGGTYVARHLGNAAVLAGEHDEARTLYEQALGPDGEARHRPGIALTKLDLAELLLNHYPEQRDEALEHVDSVIQEFREMNMGPSLERALRHKMEAQGIGSTDIMTSIDAVAAVVQTEQPDLRRHAAPDGTVTLLFTDIEGSTPLNERLGDQRWMDLLREHNALVREELRSHGGYEVKTEGDGFMVAFGSARKALQCAIAVQRSFAKHNESAEEPLRIRIGLHTGEAVREAGDFYGRHVNLASRIADQAQGGEVLVSALLKELTDSAGDIAFDDGREVELKGLGRQRVYEVTWK